MTILMHEGVFPKNLIYLRKKHRMSRRQLAELIGMSPYILRDIENEKCSLLISLDVCNPLPPFLHPWVVLSS